MDYQFWWDRLISEGQADSAWPSCPLKEEGSACELRLRLCLRYFMWPIKTNNQSFLRFLSKAVQ